jgi:FkbM family methyltransferase
VSTQCPASWRLLLARLRASLWRFRTLPYTEVLFADVSNPCVLERSLFGFRLLVDASRSNAQRLLYLEGERFLLERHLLAGLARRGSHVVDVGANIGYYLLLWESLVGPGGFVHCLEPEPDNLVELRRNVSANCLKNVAVLPVAAGAQDTSIFMTFGINSAVATGDQKGYNVPLRTLRSLFAGERVDLIKIDVEGYEGEVLHGAAAILERKRPALFLEVHPWLLSPGHTADSILARLRQLYSSLEVWESLTDTGLARKAAVRYGLLPPIRRISDSELPTVVTASRQQPFWVVCRPSRPDPAAGAPPAR